jgi:hypothetical protein
MRFYLAAIFSVLMVLPATAQPWYARGQFNNWPGSGDTSNQLTDLGGGHYSATVSDPGALCPGGACEFKIANLDWSVASPGGNSKAALNGSGELTVHLWDNTNWSDGWYPRYERRVGYDDPGHGWELMGTFFDNFATPTAMANQGSGLFHAQLPLNAGFYDFKFRKAGDWGINYGQNFSNGSGNNTIRVFTNGDLWNFDLDLPNGRWRAYPTSPQPDRTGDEHADARDYVMIRKTDNTPAANNAWRGSFGYSPWYMRGSFNDFGGLNANYLMTDAGGGHYTGTVTGLTPGNDYEYKLANFDFTNAAPGSNGKVRADDNGEIHFHLYEQPTGGWTDGWSPNDAIRVGYQDHNKFDWEIMSSLNGFSTPITQLTDQGNGLHTGSFAFDTAGTYTFKFRQQGDWNTSIGDNFGNSAADNQIVVATNNDVWNFELDLPHGRWRAFHPAGVGAVAAVPEPGSIALAICGLAIMGFARRRERD